MGQQILQDHNSTVHLMHQIIYLAPVNIINMGQVCNKYVSIDLVHIENEYTSSHLYICAKIDLVIVMYGWCGQSSQHTSS